MVTDIHTPTAQKSEYLCGENIVKILQKSLAKVGRVWYNWLESAIWWLGAPSATGLLVKKLFMMEEELQ